MISHSKIYVISVYYGLTASFTKKKFFIKDSRFDTEISFNNGEAINLYNALHEFLNQGNKEKWKNLQLDTRNPKLI